MQVTISQQNTEGCIIQHAKSEIIDSGYSVSAPVFFSEPPSGSRSLIPTSTIDLDEHIECLGPPYIEGTTTYFHMRRQSVPEAPKTLADISREVLLRQNQLSQACDHIAPNPSYGHDALPKAPHTPERTYRGRVTPDGDSLRRDTLQRRSFPSLALLPRLYHLLRPELKPQLFPRAGDPLRLHQDDSTSLIDDWRLGT